MKNFKEKLLFTCAKKIITLTFLYLFCVKSLSAYSFFSSYSYSLPLSKSILLSPSHRIQKNIKWYSSNSNIASVDRYGIVKANDIGTATISAVKNGVTFKCNVNVTNPESVRSVYTNIPKENENLIVYVVTPKNVSNVKIKINGTNYEKETYCSTKNIDGNNYIWFQNFGQINVGKYSIVAQSKINGSWESSLNSKIDFNVSSSSNKTSEVSLNSKFLSREGMDFIIKKEGFSSYAYTDLANCLTTGCGKVIYPYSSFYNPSSKSEAYQEFLTHVEKCDFVSSLNNFLISNGIKFNQNQFDALLSFSYNLGKGWMRNSFLKDCILNCSNFSNENIGTVTSDNGIFLRSEPNKFSRRLASVYYGNKLTLLNPNKINGNWYYVRTSHGQVGYCCSDFVFRNFSKNGERSLNSIDKFQFVREYLKYHHAGKKCYKGLLIRRLEELDIFFEGNYNSYRPYGKYPIPSCCHGKI